MIFGEHDFGPMRITPGLIGGGTDLLCVEMEASHESGMSLTGWTGLSRGDVERLRDLCNEALA